MKKIGVLCLIVLISLTLTGCIVKKDDIKQSFNIIVKKIKEKKPEANTEEMVNYLIDKAKKDSLSNDKNTLSFSLKYIKNNIDSINGDNKVMENLIYYGAILQYSSKDSDLGIYTTIGMKTIEAVKDVYVKDNDYKKRAKDIDKTKLQIVKALLSRVDI